MGRKGSGGKGKSKGKAASKAASEETSKGSGGKSKGKAPVGPPRVADAVQAPDPTVARCAKHWATGSLFKVYTCDDCGMAPFNPKPWLRCTKQTALALPGGTTEHGYWQCPDCGYLYWPEATGRAGAAASSDH